MLKLCARIIAKVTPDEIRTKYPRLIEPTWQEGGLNEGTDFMLIIENINVF